MKSERGWLVGVGTVMAGLILAGVAAPTAALAQPGAAAAAAPLTLDAFRGDGAACYDRSVQPQTTVVDSHIHFRPFGGPAVPFEEIVQYLEATGVLFANVYGIGQMLPASSSCTYYLDCPGTLLAPTLRNDFVNAANAVVKTPEGLHLTLAMTFPDLADPDSVLDGMALLDDGVPWPLPVDGRGQPREAGGLPQWAGAGAGRSHRRLGRLHGGAARARHPHRHPLGPRAATRSRPSTCR